MNVFAKLDEIPSMILEVIKETKRYGHTVGRTDHSEARDVKLKIPGTPTTVRICISLIFSLIMVGFAWVFFADNLKECTKTTYLNDFLEK